MADRIAFAAAVRAASVQFLQDYRDDAEINLQIYPARPASIQPPTAFVDRMTERVDRTVSIRQRRPRAELLVLHGLFDSADTAAQRDAFVDGFMDWVEDRPDQADPNTTIELVAVDDNPTYVPTWLKPELQRAYYATRIVLEGFTGN